MNNLVLNPNGSVTLCAKRTCCPVMTPDPEDSMYVFITDDNGNKIRILKAQAKLMGQGVDVIDESASSKKELLFD